MLSGNRNFEGRINPDVKMNYLASPPLVVAYALAGTMDIDLVERAARRGRGRRAGLPARHLADASTRSRETIEHGRAVGHVPQELRAASSTATSAGTALEVPTGDRFAWDDDSTYVRNPPYFEGMPREPAPVTDIDGARVLALLGDSVTTDHISPAGRDQEGQPGRRAT